MSQRMKSRPSQNGSAALMARRPLLSTARSSAASCEPETRGRYSPARILRTMQRPSQAVIAVSTTLTSTSSNSPTDIEDRLVADADRQARVERGDIVEIVSQADRRDRDGRGSHE